MIPDLDSLLTFELECKLSIDPTQNIIYGAMVVMAGGRTYLWLASLVSSIEQGS
jgi:hypothetical protein